jgi:ABC-type antimicrobial peptide transport system permease subunit
MTSIFKKPTIQEPVGETLQPDTPRVSKKSRFARFWYSVANMGSFIILLLVYLIAKSISHLFHGRFQPFATGVLNRAVKLFDNSHVGSISRVDLIELSLKNMMAKKTRTVVTIGGMTLGIATIVFLVSIGYGLQQLVISRVARLEEMKQADISPQPGAKIVIDDKALSSIQGLGNVQKVLPLISVVGKVNYQNSVSDMAVYGVTTDYLTESAIKPIEGKVFNSNNLVMETSLMPGVVAGASDVRTPAAVGDEIQSVSFTIEPTTWLKVRDNPTTGGKILGYTKRTEGENQGTEVWGASYVSNDGRGKAGITESGKPLGKWVKATVPLWTQTTCDPATQGDCEGGHYMVLRGSDNTQTQKEGYIAEISMTTTGATIQRASNVLGASTTSNDTASISAIPDPNAGVNFVTIASISAVPASSDVQTISLSNSAIKQAVVNRAVLKVLGINEAEAIGKTFEVSFVVVGDLLPDPTKRIESAPATYTIVGVTPDSQTPMIYVPFIDLRSLGVTQYSQSKVVVVSQNDLPKIRKQVEAMGFVTRSVADTVAQINSLFSTAKIILALLGMVALAVAALGMFNTLTVSLLERTREVGLMKAMGMKSSEVQELFLTESMIMGFVGGLCGILIGFIAGKLLGLILSVFSLIKGVGFVDISYLPFPFLFTIILLSLMVGVFTGMYPARRATKISALNALRYE